MAQKQNSRPLFDQRPQHPRRPRIGLLGREKRLRKFSRMRERASGMLCLKNEFPDSFECLSLIGHKKMFLCPIGGQHLSCCFRDLFYPPTRLFAVYYRTCLYRAAELSSRRFSSENGAPKPKIPIIETNGKISVQPQHLLCKHVSTLFILTITEKK